MDKLITDNGQTDHHLFTSWSPLIYELITLNLLSLIMHGGINSLDAQMMWLMVRKKDLSEKDSLTSFYVTIILTM